MKDTAHMLLSFFSHQRRRAKRFKRRRFRSSTTYRFSSTLSLPSSYADVRRGDSPIVSSSFIRFVLLILVFLCIAYAVWLVFPRPIVSPLPKQPPIRVIF